jgi:hypothetical protein
VGYLVSRTVRARVYVIAYIRSAFSNPEVVVVVNSDKGNVEKNRKAK